MIIKCRICGNEFEHPDDKKGKKPVICKSDACKKEKKRQDNITFRTRHPEPAKQKMPKSEKKQIPRPDTSKAGWPEDTKKCVDCGQFFMDDGRSKLCPVCKAARKEERYSTKRADTVKPVINRSESLHLKSIDESLAEAKAAGYSPEEYGKYKAAKALAKAGPVDINVPGAKPRLAEYDIYKESGYEGHYQHDPETVKEDEEVICKECGFDIEPIESGILVECPACGETAEAVETLCEPVEDCTEKINPPLDFLDRRSLFKFIRDIEYLADLMIDDELKLIEVLPLAQAVLRKGFSGLVAKRSDDNEVAV